MQNFYMCPGCCEVYTYDELMDQFEYLGEPPTCVECNYEASNFITIFAESFILIDGDRYEKETKTAFRWSNII